MLRGSFVVNCRAAHVCEWCTLYFWQDFFFQKTASRKAWNQYGLTADLFVMCILKCLNVFYVMFIYREITSFRHLQNMRRRITLKTVQTDISFPPPPPPPPKKKSQNLQNNNNNNNNRNKKKRRKRRKRRKSRRFYTAPFLIHVDQTHKNKQTETNTKTNE